MSKAWSKEFEHVHTYPSRKQYARWLECAEREDRAMSNFVKRAVNRYCDFAEEVLEGKHADP